MVISSRKVVINLDKDSLIKLCDKIGNKLYFSSSETLKNELTNCVENHKNSSLNVNDIMLIIKLIDVYHRNALEVNGKMIIELLNEIQNKD
jgi:hypothetical protein